MTDLEEFRKAKDDLFKNDVQSPLTAEQRKEFNGLKYFSANPELRLEVTVEKFPQVERIQMPTSTGDVQSYTRFGRFKFKVDEQEAELTIYSDRHGYFLPFVDALASKETYGAGRYLEPRQLAGGKFLVDFNFSYNPYCAYNEMWSCPITPMENRVKVPIRAGEKIYHE
jgi:uncharacterized protein (DUF1684 family)